MHIYFSGIGGVGIGPLAMLAQDAGYTVSGSDLRDSTLLQQLRDRGVSVHIGQDGSQIKSANDKSAIDWLVHTSALPEQHPELVFAKEHDIKTSKRAEFLNALLQETDLKLVAIAGTHGKTTSTGMFVWAAQQLDIETSYSIGSSISFGPPAQYRKDSKLFIYECDEFDRNFLDFHPHTALITSVDYDHPDTYETESEYIEAFRTFVQQSNNVLAWSGDQNKIYNERIVWLDEEDFRIDSIKLAGRHNRENAFMVASALTKLTGRSMSDAMNALDSFPGTARRFERIAQNLYSDYAHHPIEIAATLQLAKELNPDVIIVYQPHQNIRQHEIMKENAYTDCFNGAKKVYWLPTFYSRENENLAVLTPEHLISSVNPDITTDPAQMNDELWQKIEEHTAQGELVVVMSAGDLDAWLKEQASSTQPS